MSDFLSFLAQRRRDVVQKMQHLQALLNDIDRSEALYRESQSSGELPFEPPQARPATSHYLGRDASTGRLIVPVDVRPMATLKARIVDTLKQNPYGLRSGHLLAHLRGMGTPDLQRTTMSPQLSRLQADGVIRNVGGVWQLVENHEATPSVEDMAK